MNPILLRLNHPAGDSSFRLVDAARSDVEEWTRRSFLKSTAGAIGLLLAFQFANGRVRAATPAAMNGVFSPNAFVRIAPDNTVTIIINHAEMGQSILTGLSMLLAEELDLDWSKVRTEFAPVAPVYNHTFYQVQITGGSTSTWSEFERFRSAGAAARALFIGAAAEQWGVPVAECRTEAGQVVHADGRRASYGSLAEAAAKLPPPSDVPLKDPRNFRLIGKPTPRLDSRAKVTGTAEFGLDVRLPGTLIAVVARAPAFGATLDTFDPAPALAVPGVRSVLRVPSGIAVIAADFWAAKCGRDALTGVTRWRVPPESEIDTTTQAAQFAATARTPGLVVEKTSDVKSALKNAAKIIEADYAVPYLAHAPMEPLNAIVDYRGDQVEVWTGAQFPTMDQNAVAAVFGLKPQQVLINTTFLGGGFGRRSTPNSDWVTEAAHIVKAAHDAGIAAPIKTVWSREDDLAGGYYRPMNHHRLVGGLDKQGSVVAWQQTIVGQSILIGTSFGAAVKDGIDETSIEGAVKAPYRIPARQIELHYAKAPVPVMAWRSVGHSHTSIAVECFLDELAHAAGRDPLELRRELLPADSRERRVLELVIEKSGYGKTKLPSGHAHGFAVHGSFGSYLAQVAEVSVENGRVRVHRVTAGVDCGVAVNPLAIEAQIHSGVTFALSALLYGEISLDKGRVQQTNFHQYRVVRMDEMPKVDVHIIAAGDKIGGIGEAGVPPLAPAVLNAVFAATGKRVRRLPLARTSFA